MAFLHSDPPREPFLNAPASVLWLLATLIAIHLVVSYAPLPAGMVDYVVLIPSQIPAQGWRAAAPLIGHIFIQDSWTALIIRCLWLLAFGPIVARRYGLWLFLAFFMVCGIAGGAADVARHWGAAIPFVGASGAIAGLMAAGFRLLRWPGETPGPRLAPIASGPVLIFSAFWILLNAGFDLAGLSATGIGTAAGYVVGLFGIDLVEMIHLARARRRLRS